MQEGTTSAEVTQPRKISAERVAAEAPKETRTGSALTVVTPIVRGQETALRQLLDEIGTHIAQNDYFSFDAIQSVHFLRWVVIDPATGSDQSLLAFESNYDGSVEEHLTELFAVAARGMNAIYGHCVGYPASAGVAPPPSLSAAVAYLLQHSIPSRAFTSASLASASDESAGSRRSARPSSNT